MSLLHQQLDHLLLVAKAFGQGVVVAFKFPQFVVGHSYLAGDLDKAGPIWQLLAALCFRLDMNQLLLHLAVLRLHHLEYLRLSGPLLEYLVLFLPEFLLLIGSSWTL